MSRSFFGKKASAKGRANGGEHSGVVFKQLPQMRDG
jgi:hypothetical protein